MRTSNAPRFEIYSISQKTCGETLGYLTPKSTCLIVVYLLGETFEYDDQHFISRDSNVGVNHGNHQRAIFANNVEAIRHVSNANRRQ